MKTKVFQENLRRLIDFSERNNIHKIMILNDSNQTWLGASRLRGSLLIIDISERDIRYYTPLLEYYRSYDIIKSNIDQSFNLKIYAYYRYKLQEVPEDINVLDKDLNKIISEEIKVSSEKELRCGYDDINMIFSDELRDVLKKYCIDIRNEVLDIRSVKTSYEIEIISKAAEISIKALRKLLDEELIGYSEKQIAARLLYMIRFYGADEEAFPLIVASASNSVYPHSKPEDRIIRYGDMILIDIGARINEYNSDMTRMIVHKGSGAYEGYIEAVNEAVNNSLEKISAGIKGSFIDNIARETLRRRGLAKYFIHSLGHGVGIDVHEKPSLSPDSQDILRENMIFTIEPGIYIKDLVGIRIEELVLLDKRGPKVLTDMERIIFY